MPRGGRRPWQNGARGLQLIRVWRICSRRIAKQAFTGEGARLFPGRWNERGVPVVYTAESLALAVLEMLVHTSPELLPRDLVFIPADIPSRVRIQKIESSELPRDWRVYPAPLSLQSIGSEWLRSRRSAVLSVPSAVVPQERCILLNPLHAKFSQIEIGKPQRLTLDPRRTLCSLDSKRPLPCYIRRI